MTCYIVDRKVNNFSKTSGFAITVAIAACSSFHVYASLVSTFFIACY